MSSRTRIAAMDLTASGAQPPDRQALDEALQGPALRAILDASRNGYVIFDLDGNVALVNTTSERLLGVRRAEVEQRPVERLLRKSRVPLDSWFHATTRGAGDTVLTSTDGSRTVQASRFNIAVMGERLPYRLLTFRADYNALQEPPRARLAGNLVFPPSLAERLAKALKAHQRGARVLLLGETGVGKTAIARYIHDANSKDGAAFIHVNCGSIPETLFESEMFGYERGAFTGALQAGKRGFVEAAAGGTLFLDEVGEIPLSSQVKLLKFLEDGTVQPVGSSISRRVDTRVIAATNRDLRVMVQQRQFRTDLYYRIATFPVTVPRLRDRPDKEKLLDRFIERVNATRNPKLRLSAQCRAEILRSSFPGNLRELRSIVEYLDIVADEVAELEHLSPDVFETTVQGREPSVQISDVELSDEHLKDQVARFEQSLIERAIEQHGSKREAARHLGVDIATLIRKQKRGKDNAFEGDEH